MLSKGIRVIPQFDGDGFFFVPSRTEAMIEPTENVFENAVVGFLNAIGIVNPADRFRRVGPGYQGRKLPKADLKALAEITCRRFQPKEKRQVQDVCAALTERESRTPEFERFTNAIERVEVEYFFVQEREVKDGENPKTLAVPKKVPLEHVGIRVEGREGMAGLFVSGRVIIDDVTVRNVISIGPEEVLNASSKALTKIPGVRAVSKQLLAPVELLLLPYGGTGGIENRPALKYAYRTALLADFLGLKGIFYLWLDADTGEILQLIPAMGSATAGGKTFLRDPSSLPVTEYATFHVDDPPSGGQFTLTLSGIFGRIDMNGDGIYDIEVAEPSEKFDQAAFSMSPTVQSVACFDGNNKEFAQVDLMTTISRYRAIFNSAGPALWAFPRTERAIWVNHASTGCDAFTGHDGFRFGLCPGYSDPACPDVGELNAAHDHTVVAHEFGHAFTSYQYGYPEDLDPAVKRSGDRPASWCKETSLESTAPDPCPMPTSPSDIFHDFADAWAHLLEDTNCFGGWVAKNIGGTNSSKDCTAWTSELNQWPRQSDVVQDHFPEHRKAAYNTLDSSTAWQMPYSDMQIAAAALWSVRQGLKSRDPIMGALLYQTRFMRTLATTGWLGQLD
ncbi:MAG TPA: hypothetical protein VKP13_14300, partial [Nitrospira sp.]|nr:hypothetical protein [Nitrospira sp.]